MNKFYTCPECKQKKANYEGLCLNCSSKEDTELTETIKVSRNLHRYLHLEKYKRGYTSVNDLMTEIVAKDIERNEK